MNILSNSSNSLNNRDYHPHFIHKEMVSPIRIEHVWELAFQNKFILTSETVFMSVFHRENPSVRLSRAWLGRRRRHLASCPFWMSNLPVILMCNFVECFVAPVIIRKNKTKFWILVFHKYSALTFEVVTFLLFKHNLDFDLVG